MKGTKPQDTGTIITRRGSPPEISLGPFKTKLGTEYSIIFRVHKRGNWVKSLRLKASSLPTDPETLSILINEDIVVAL